MTAKRGSAKKTLFFMHINIDFTLNIICYSGKRIENPVRSLEDLGEQTDKVLATFFYTMHR